MSATFSQSDSSELRERGICALEEEREGVRPSTAQLQEPDLGRELATEFVERRHITMRELMSWRRLPRQFENLRLGIWAAAEERREMQQTINRSMEV